MLNLTTNEIITIIFSFIALLVSFYTAYRSFWARFSGKVWCSNRIALIHSDGIPSLGLACFFENIGAKPGILDDMRVKVDLKEVGTSYYFYPLLMRNEYSIYKPYSVDEWYPYGMISMPPLYRAEKFIILKPQDDKFKAAIGTMTLRLEVRWSGQSRWTSVEELSFNLDQTATDKWNDSTAPSWQVTSNSVLMKRIF